MENRNKTRAILITVFVHSVIILVLMFTYLTTPDPPLGSDGGFIVNVGYADAGYGDEQPMTEEVSEVKDKNSTPASEEDLVEEEVVTQDDPSEEIIVEKKEKKEKEKKKKKKKEKEPVEEVKTKKNPDFKPEETKEEPKTEPVRTTNPNAIYKGKTNKAKSDGDVQGGTGDMGNENGDPNSKVYSGKGSGTGTGSGDGDGEGDGPGGKGTGKDKGNGIHYDLSGRKAIKRVKPDENSKATGKVVVSITVDQEGNVISAKAGARGSTTTNAGLYKAAEEAALKTKFNPSPDAPDEQRGNIVFTFVLQ